MAKKSIRIPMYHPWRKDEYGHPAIQHINPATVKSGKAQIMGYVPVPVVEAPPTIAPKPAPKTTSVTKKGEENADWP